MDSSALARAISDLGPEAYARWRASEIGAITERLERQLILELVGDVSSCRVLDVGCGDGEFAADRAAERLDCRLDDNEIPGIRWSASGQKLT